MNSEKIFELALGLEIPWKVGKIEMQINKNKKELHIYLLYNKEHYMFKDGTNKSRIYDHNDRTWRHLNFFEHECYLHCEVPRVRGEDGKITTIEVPWARSGSGFTLRFEAYSMLQIELEMPEKKVGKTISTYPNRIWTIFNYWISIAYQKEDHSKLKNLGIDETSSKKGHQYITLAVNMDESSVVHGTAGKGADTIKKIANYLESKDCERSQIENICIDLSPSFIAGVQTEFETSNIVFDRFHVKQLRNKAMDEVRKLDYRIHKEELKGAKYLFLKNHDKLTKEQKYTKNYLLNLLPNIGEAYRLKELFDTFWTIKDPEIAKGYLAYWCDLAKDSNINPMIKFANTVNAHWTGITNFTVTKLTNGILEGINSKIQLAKRRARGYANTTNFINMIYFIAGKLKFNYPHYLT